MSDLVKAISTSGIAVLLMTILPGCSGDEPSTGRVAGYAGSHGGAGAGLAGAPAASGAGAGGHPSGAGGASLGGRAGGLAEGGAGTPTAGGPGGLAGGGASGTTNAGAAGGSTGGHGGADGGSSNAAAGGRAGDTANGGAANGGAQVGGMAGAAGNAGAAGRSGPPLGWASWNSFAAKINHTVIKAQADAMVASGLAAAGYEYVNIDEGWWQGTRDAAGNITVDTTDWPGGMQAIADYIHSLGLKAGIYTDAGKDGCGYYYPTGRPAAPGSGSEGHYEQDFLAFSQWGFDFVKVDWCGGDKEGLSAPTAYAAIAAAIAKATAATARPLVLSVCNWGKQNPWDWAPSLATLWRTSGDIIYYGDPPELSRVLANFDSAQHASAQSPGHYNDPDMLIVGMKGFSTAQNRTHMALWAMSGAPLLAGNDLTTMSSDTKAVLTNPAVLAIDQDALATQGKKVADASGHQVYSKVLSGTGRRAVLLLNRGSAAATISVRFDDLGLGATATIQNVWTAADLGAHATSYAVEVPAQDSVLLLVSEGG